MRWETGPMHLIHAMGLDQTQADAAAASHIKYPHCYACRFFNQIPSKQNIQQNLFLFAKHEALHHHHHHQSSDHHHQRILRTCTHGGWNCCIQKRPLKIRTPSSGIDRCNLGWKMLPEEQRNKSHVQNTFPVSSREERRAGRSCGVRVREREETCF
jgi:hypothetical protein